MSASGSAIRSYFAPGKGSIIETGADCVHRAMMFGDPTKLRDWCENAGHGHSHDSATLQPSGNVSRKLKDVGTIKSTKAIVVKKRKRE